MIGFCFFAWFLEIDPVRKVFVCVCVCTCVCLYLCLCLCPQSYKSLTVWCGMIWTPCDWLNKIYSFCMAAIVSIVSRCGLRNEVHIRNQPNNIKLALYKPLLCFYSHLKQLWMSKKTEHFSYKGGYGVHGRTRINLIKRRADLSYR